MKNTAIGWVVNLVYISIFCVSIYYKIADLEKIRDELQSDADVVLSAEIDNENQRKELEQVKSELNKTNTRIKRYQEETQKALEAQLHMVFLLLLPFWPELMANDHLDEAYLSQG